MSLLRRLTSESVTEGHPDKVCDLISDAILDAILREDPQARVAVETMVTTGMVHVAGEVTTSAYVEIPHIVRSQIKKIGYTSSEIGFDGDSCGVLVSIGSQSPDIASGVDKSWEQRGGSTDPLDAQGAGDQGSMFGYATNETSTLMPLPIFLAHRMAERLTAVRRSGEFSGLRPDGKTQVTIGYDGTTAQSVAAVVLSTQHEPEVHLADLKAGMAELVINPVLEEHGGSLDTASMELYVNPAGPFVTGGPMGDAGLTGRKIIVDSYGGVGHHGGGAFSGKDPSKVDRSASYAMRWVAKNVVAAGLAARCEVQVAYGIGIAHPVGLYVDTFGTGLVPDEAISAAVQEVFDLRPAAIIRDLDLLRPIYSLSTNYGHFGRELPELTWESTDRAADLAAAARA